MNTCRAKIVRWFPVMMIAWGTALNAPASGQVFRLAESSYPAVFPAHPRERAVTLEEESAGGPMPYDSRWRAAEAYALAALIEPDREEKLGMGHAAREHALAAIELQPRGVEGHYWLAVAAGILAEWEEGLTRIRRTEESWREAGWVLEVDSLHAGAHHVRGRVHAAIQRVDGVPWFVRRVILGGELGNTSWEEALFHLESAITLDPQVPMYRFDLAMVYRDLGYDELHRQALEAVLSVDGSGNHWVDADYRLKAETLLGAQGAGL